MMNGKSVNDYIVFVKTDPANGIILLFSGNILVSTAKNKAFSPFFNTKIK